VATLTQAGTPIPQRSRRCTYTMHWQWVYLSSPHPWRPPNDVEGL